MLHMAGYGRRFDWGFHDEENNNKGSYNDPTLYSSCMTTVESRPGHRHKYCDTKQVIGSTDGM